MGSLVDLTGKPWSQGLAVVSGVSRFLVDLVVETMAQRAFDGVELPQGAEVLVGHDFR